MQFNSMKIRSNDSRQAVSGPSQSSASRVVLRVSISLVALVLGFPSSANGTGNATDGHAGNVFKHWIEVGQASWYGLKFQGKKTATGEAYDMNLLTCAHRSLPLGSWVKVTNLKNHKTVVVRVNDRGPALNTRIVDLSYAAAQSLGLRGVGKVRLDTMKAGDPDLAKALLAQVQMPPIPGVLTRYAQKQSVF